MADFKTAIFFVLFRYNLSYRNIIFNNKHQYVTVLIHGENGVKFIEELLKDKNLIYIIPLI